MKITQITAVVENHDIYNSGVEANTEATIYGLGDDSQLYFWGVVKKKEIKLDEPNEDGKTSYYEREMGWLKVHYYNG